MRGLRILGAAYLAASMLASVVAAEQHAAGVVTAVHVVMKRQDNDEGDNERTTPAPRRTVEPDEPEETGEAEPTQRGSRTTSKARDDDEEDNNEDDEDKETSKGKNAKTTARPTRRPNPLDPAGGITMIKPDIREGSQYYKFREKITFEWNMTSVQKSPNALNVEAYCTSNSHYYTITANMSAQETKVVWDTKEHLKGEFQLVQGQYGLWIYDSEKPRTNVAKGGELAPYAGQLRFVVYSPKPDEKYDEFDCIGCSDANSLMVPKMLLVTSVIFLTSFMWFLGVAGIF